MGEKFSDKFSAEFVQFEWPLRIKLNILHLPESNVVFSIVKHANEASDRESQVDS